MQTIVRSYLAPSITHAALQQLGMLRYLDQIVYGIDSVHTNGTCLSITNPKMFTFRSLAKLLNQ